MRKQKNENRCSVEEVARLMGVHPQTIRIGLRMHAFDWGYAIKTSSNRYTYIINRVKFFEIERISPELAESVGKKT